MTDITKQQSVCSVCGTPMAPGAERCASCGTTHDKRHACPFCGVVAQPQPHSELRFACPSCGAPRIPTPPDLEPSKAMTSALSTVRSARSSRAVWRVASGLGLAFGLLSTLLLVGVALIASPSLLPLIAAGTVAAMPLVFAALAWTKARQRQEQVQRSLDQAWLEAAKALTASKGSVRASEMVEAFGIEEDAAHQLIAHLGAHQEITTDVTEEGELALSVRGHLLRVAEPPPQPLPEDPAPQGEEVEMELDHADHQDARVIK